MCILKNLRAIELVHLKCWMVNIFESSVIIYFFFRVDERFLEGGQRGQSGPGAAKIQSCHDPGPSDYQDQDQPQKQHQDQ
jgi:hypothetical protein